MKKQLWAFVTGIFFYQFIEALWTAPDYRVHGDISWQIEALWIVVSLVSFAIPAFMWYLHNRR